MVTINLKFFLSNMILQKVVWIFVAIFSVTKIVLNNKPGVFALEICVHYSYNSDLTVNEYNSLTSYLLPMPVGF